MLTSGRPAATSQQLGVLVGVPIEEFSSWGSVLGFPYSLLMVTTVETISKPYSICSCRASLLWINPSNERV